MPSWSTGYSHVNVHVSDLERARDFYTNKLGFEELNRPNIGNPGIWYMAGALSLHISVTEGFKAQDVVGIGPHFAMYVPTERFHETIAELEANGVRMVRRAMQREDDKIWAAFCLDPDGNLIEFTDLGPNEHQKYGLKAKELTAVGD